MSDDLAVTTGSLAVVGVGAIEGLGARIARRFAIRGLQTFVMGRSADQLEAVVADIQRHRGSAVAVPGDATSEQDLCRLLQLADGAPGGLRVAIYNAGGNRPKPTLETSAEFFEDVWRTNCLGGFIFGREAMRIMAPKRAGTCIFTGASASLRGRPTFAAFASSKAALRAVAQSLARDFGPQGVHVAHVVIDGAIAGARIRANWPHLVEQRGEDGLLQLDAIAETYWHIHAQHPSAWTHEIDLRPFKETW